MCDKGGFCIIPIALLFGLISMFTLVFGYAQYPIYGGNYKQGIGKITDYKVYQFTCTRTCNCHAVGRKTVCNYCEYTCYYADIYYNVNSEVTFTIFKGPYDYDPTQYLPYYFPIGSELKLYYSNNYIVYGSDLERTRTCFIVGMVFIGLSALLILCLILAHVIKWIVEKKPCIVQPPPPSDPLSPSTTPTSV